jgi:hypothetical protein
MTTLAVMMNWYAPIDDLVEKECIDCGDIFEVPVQNAGRKERCDSCAETHNSQRHRIERDPEIELVKAVISSALKDHDREFIQNNGIQLWLRAVGIGITPSMNKRIEKMGR